jgi:hypothetical protein
MGNGSRGRLFRSNINGNHITQDSPNHPDWQLDGTIQSQAKDGSEHIDETLVCWALVQSDSDDDELPQVVGMVRSISKSSRKVVFADEEKILSGLFQTDHYGKLRLRQPIIRPGLTERPHLEESMAYRFHADPRVTAHACSGS